MKPLLEALRERLGSGEGHIHRGADCEGCRRTRVDAVLLATVERLVYYAAGDARCPVCDGVERCDRECEHAYGDPVGYRRKLAARAALAGEVLHDGD